MDKRLEKQINTQKSECILRRKQHKLQRTTDAREKHEKIKPQNVIPRYARK